MIGQSEEREVMVYLKRCTITIIHRTKTTWAAAGEYEGRHLVATNRSANAAARSWVEKAKMSDPFY